jgi:hypothetical protein
MTLKEPEGERSALSEFLREVGDAAARATPSPRFPKRAKPREEPQFELFPSPHESAAAQRYLERRADPNAKSQLSFKGDENTNTLTIVSADHDKDHVAPSSDGYVRYRLLSVFRGHAQPTAIYRY